MNEQEPSFPQARTCTFCGSPNIVEELIVKASVDHEMVGLVYRTIGFLTSTEPLFADLCSDCGTISRFFVRNTDRNWKTR
jgi:hypothetical protein